MVANLLFIITLLNIIRSGDLEITKMGPDEITTKLYMMNKMRCTLRYTPGACAGVVEPVWQFVYQTQNCTERLGCLNYDFNANRFTSYWACIKTCQSYIEGYLGMVEMATKDDQTLRLGDNYRKFHWHYFYSDLVYPEGGDTREDEKYDDEDELTVVYKDLVPGSQKRTRFPDIDNMPGKIRHDRDYIVHDHD